jgi:hypothetical protein
MVKMSEVAAGDKLVTYGFSCVPDETLVTVMDSLQKGMYFHCDRGKHYLSSQLNEDGELVGLLRPET